MKNRVPGGVPSGHLDQFVRNLLPPTETWPVFDYSGPPFNRIPDYMNAAEALIDTAVASGYGDKPVYYYEGETWSFRHLLDRAERIARVLVEDYGLIPGNRVLLRSGNSPMLVACWLAVLKAGGICVTTMPLLRSEELEFIMNRVEVRFALCEESMAEELDTASLSAGSLERIGYFSPLGSAMSAKANLDHAEEDKPAGFLNIRTSADDVAIITFTSGTTGKPKAAAHFHRDIIAVSETFPRVYTVEPDEVISGAPSMAFTYGMAAFIIFPLRYRVPAVLTDRPTPDSILHAVERHRVTSLYCVPTSYHQMLEEVGKYDLKSLRKCASAGENLQTKLFEHWVEKTGLRLVNGIGATEMLSHFVCESLEVDRIGSTGKAIPGYDVQLIDKEGRILPPDSRGRIAVRGPTGCRYLDDVERQKVFVQNGWNVTGDVFVRDRDGYFWYVDREDDIIVSSGYNISPQEVERALLEHPLVDECAVVGIKDDIRGNLVRACIVLSAPDKATPHMARELQEFVKHRIAPYKYPRDIRFYDSLPRTRTGKIQRKYLRSQDI